MVKFRRADGRKAGELRPVKIVRHFTRYAPGSVLIEMGNTRVLCTATFQEGVPIWKEETGAGWLTAEYNMLPSSTPIRKPRNIGKIDGRSQEIQRLIGRTLRSAIDFEKLGENTIWIDCDVLQADGGTRTAAITGGYVALVDAVKFARQNKIITQNPLRRAVAAVSVGIVEGRTLLDLDYEEDSIAEVDFNVVMTNKGEFIEIQGTAEKAPFTDNQLSDILRLAKSGIKKLFQYQKKALKNV